MFAVCFLLQHTANAKVCCVLDICRVFLAWHTAKKKFVVCCFYWHMAKGKFAVCPSLRTRQTFWYTAIWGFPIVHLSLVHSTSATVWFFPLSLLYNNGYCFIIRESFPIQRSSQNLVWLPFRTINFSLVKKGSIIYPWGLPKIRESPRLCTACANVLLFRYFFLSRFYQATSSFKSLSSNLHTKPIFLNSRFVIPNKHPTHLGVQRMPHLANLYFFWCSSHCYTNLDL